MPKLLIILLIGLIFEAIGVVLLSRGLKEINHPAEIARPEPGKVRLSEVAHLVGRGVTNVHILLGVFFEALFFIALLMLMSKADVSFVWPLTSLSFVVTTIAAKIYLKEEVSPARWSGVCLIMLGAALITWTEKHKAPGASESSSVQASAGNPVSSQ